MGSAIDLRLVIAYAAGIIFLFFVGRVLVFPMRVLTKLFYNGILGGVALFIVNLVGGLFGYKIAFNLATVFTTGFLGLPGLALIVVLQQIMAV